MTPSPLLQVHELSIAFGQGRQQLTAVDHISFELHAGECLGIVGESGSGKSVTAMSLARLLPQPAGQITGGRILFDGKDVLQMSPRELQRLRSRDIGFIFQEPMNALNPVHRIGDQLIEAIQLSQPCPAEQARARALELLQQVRISGAVSCMDRFPHELSGGMRQRVVIAIALAGKPRLLISDEATTALDVTIQHQILQLIKDLQQELHASCLLISHELGIIAQSCQRVLVLYAGQVVEMAPVETIFTRPIHAYTRALLACLPQGGSEPKSLLPTIAGQVAPLSELVAGCRFCQRLGIPTEQLTQRPAWREIAPQHWVAACPRCAALP